MSNSVGTFVVVTTLLAWTASPAQAVIFGGTDSRVFEGDGWQKGAATVFNAPGRVAYWEGPPFGGGQHHAECRGDAAAFNLALADFAKIEAKDKKLIVHDGVGQSVWLNINRKPELKEMAAVDWIFVTWQVENWNRLKSLPAQFRSPDIDITGEEPTPQIDVYVGGRIKWDDVVVPDGIRVVDQRLEAHGYSIDDGRVLEGQIVNATTGEPMTAIVELSVFDETAATKWRVVKSGETDSNGAWTFTKAPIGRAMLKASAEGFASRIIAYESLDGEPGWSSHATALVKASRVAGQVVDDNGHPLAGARVSIGGTTDDDGNRYDTGLPDRFETDGQGRFEIIGVPAGWVSLHASSDGYTRIGPASDVLAPKDDVVLKLIRAGSVDVEVDFAAYTNRGGKRPDGYIVQIAESKPTAARWGGSATIDASGKYTFTAVPPGRYVLTGRPNPGSENETSEPITIDVVGGETTYATLNAR